MDSRFYFFTKVCSLLLFIFYSWLVCYDILLPSMHLLLFCISSGPGSLILPASLYSVSSLPPSFPSSQLLSSIPTYPSNMLSIPSTLPFFSCDLFYFSDCLVLFYIVCLDTSWSMAGPRENLAKAVVLECTKQGDFNKFNDFLTD